MSDGTRVPYDVAMQAANKITSVIGPECAAVVIAGSLRREKPDVGDIEIVCIPKPEIDLLGVEWMNAMRIEQALKDAGYLFPRFNGEHFKQFDAGPCKCDLFITTPTQWGVIFTIRTGSADFSHRLVTPRNQGGLLPSNLRIKDGRIWNGAEALDTPTELDLFKAIGLKWIEPKDRA